VFEKLSLYNADPAVRRCRKIVVKEYRFGDVRERNEENNNETG
jgi:hypothetical protein